MIGRAGLGSLAKVYVMVERVRSLEVRVASGAVDALAYAAAVETALHEDSVVTGRTALGEGDRAEWHVAETQRDAAVSRMERLARAREESERRLAEAREEHKASQMQSEQMQRVMERARRNELMTHGRREQAFSDDRFAARRAWTRRETNKAE